MIGKGRWNKTEKVLAGGRTVASEWIGVPDALWSGVN